MVIVVELSKSCFLTPGEFQDLNTRYSLIGDQWRQQQLTYKAMQLAEGAIHQERCLKIVTRARQDSDLVVNALLMAINDRGLQFPRFSQLLAIKAEDHFITKAEAADTSENRKILYSLLRTLQQIPPNWSYGTLRCFLEGKKVESEDAKLSGYALFKADDSWSEHGVSELAKFFTDPSSEYFEFFRKQESPTEEELAPPQPLIKKADFVITPVVNNPSWQEEGSHKSFDLDFLEQLACSLEKKGIEVSAKPATKKTKTLGIKEGDVISRKTLQALSPGDKLRVKLNCKRDANSPNKPMMFDLVIEERQGDAFVFSWLESSNQIKFKEEGRCILQQSKITGATYLGKFSGTVATQLPNRFKNIIELS